jgi:hypothetical protein
LGRRTGSTKGSAAADAAVRGLKERGGTVTDPVRPRLTGLPDGFPVEFAVDCSVVSAICRTVCLEIRFIVGSPIGFTSDQIYNRLLDMDQSAPLLPHTPLVDTLFRDGPMSGAIREYSINNAHKTIGREIIKDIIVKGNTTALATPMGAGAQSASYLYIYNGIPYILRITPLKKLGPRYFSDNDSSITEINAYSVLNSTENPYIAKLYYALSSNGREHPFKGTIFIFPYFNGETLQTKITHMKDMAKGEQVALIDLYVRHLLDACNYMSSKGIVNRDIKPENIFIPDGALPYIFDFDMSCKIVENGCKSSEFKGSRAYAIPKARSRLESGAGGFDGPTYTYSVWSDKYSVIEIIKRDLLPLIESDQDKKQILDIAITQLVDIFKGNNETNPPSTDESAIAHGLIEELINMKKSKEGGARKYKKYLSVSKSKRQKSKNRRTIHKNK